MVFDSHKDTYLSKKEVTKGDIIPLAQRKDLLYKLPCEGLESMLIDPSAHRAPGTQTRETKRKPKKMRCVTLLQVGRCRPWAVTRGLSKSVKWACHTVWALILGRNVRKLILDWTLPTSRGDVMTEHLNTCYSGRRAVQWGLRCD